MYPYQKERVYYVYPLQKGNSRLKISILSRVKIEIFLIILTRKLVFDLLGDELWGEGFSSFILLPFPYFIKEFRMIRARVQREWKDMYRSSEDGVRRELIHDHVIGKLVLSQDEDFDSAIKQIMIEPPIDIRIKRIREHFTIEMRRWREMDKAFRLNMIKQRRKRCLE